MFQSLDGYISGQLKWSFCAGVCTDGAAVKAGRLSGLIARIKDAAPESQSTHRIIHMVMMASRNVAGIHQRIE